MFKSSFMPCCILLDKYVYICCEGVCHGHVLKLVLHTG
ncbi:hypothetical protein F383_11995 [Gossypium arboreum]|uniref:Uncharacterized protein n=1 Tax=Gossypium arboreum TaxID=29729 RepID=A0A0B0PTW3_GOSAR|nr:hypothetical protein F383_11995 [Gossypium arboreum]